MFFLAQTAVPILPPKIHIQISWLPNTLIFKTKRFYSRMAETCYKRFKTARK